VRCLCVLRQVFPTSSKHATHIERRVLKIRDTDEREDLQMVAKSYYAHLHVHKSKWLTDEEMQPPGTVESGSKSKASDKLKVSERMDIKEAGFKEAGKGTASKETARGATSKEASKSPKPPMSKEEAGGRGNCASTSGGGEDKAKASAGGDKDRGKGGDSAKGGDLAKGGKEERSSKRQVCSASREWRRPLPGVVFLRVAGGCAFTALRQG
jgi:hypothetical protein